MSDSQKAVIEGGVTEVIQEVALSALSEKEKQEEVDKKYTGELLNATRRFLTQLDALMETTNRIMAIVTKSRERAEKERNDFLEPLFAESEDKETARFKYPSPQFREYQQLTKAWEKAREAERLVPRSFLVSMVIQYDTYLAATVKALFKLKPEKIRNADTSIKVRELVTYNSLEEVFQVMIDDEIDEALRGSHLSQLRWLEKRFDFQVDEKDLLLQKFIELTERRNVFVHADGIANRQYLQECKKLSTEAGAKIDLGKRLVSNRLYLEQAHDTLFQIGLQVQQIAWRKQREDQRERQDSSLNEVVFELLMREDYTLARNIADFAAQLRDLASDRNKRLFTLNRAQAYRWSGKPEQARKIVDELDWSSSAAYIKMASAILRDDMSSALRFMKDVPTDGEDGLDQDAYRTWPIFKEARKDASFQDAFQEKFREPLIAETIDIPKNPDVEPTTLAESNEKGSDETLIN